MKRQRVAEWTDLSVALRRAGVDTLVLVGAHGSGKSTLRAQLAERLGWRSDLELGERLRREALEQEPALHAQVIQPEFDRKVFEQELARDVAFLQLPDETRGGRVVETWHPGNLAYAQERSPEFYAEAQSILFKHCAQQQARTWVIPLAIQPETLRARQHEPGPAHEGFTQFLWAVGVRAHAQAEVLRLRCLPPLSTDVCALEETLLLLRQALLDYLP